MKRRKICDGGIADRTLIRTIRKIKKEELPESGIAFILVFGITTVNMNINLLSPHRCDTRLKQQQLFNATKALKKATRQRIN